MTKSTEKSLGQILYEVYEGHGLPYCQLDNRDIERYEEEAQAVAAVVREQCAQACEAAARRVGLTSARRKSGAVSGPAKPAHFDMLMHLAAAIRSIK